MAALMKNTKRGRRQDKSISVTTIAGVVRLGPPGGAADGDVALTLSYSNWLGFSGTFGGGAVAFSTRETRLERAAAGFCPHSCSTILTATSIGSLTMPLAGSPIHPG